MPTFGEKIAIDMWMGPLYAIHDFATETIWYVVKTLVRGKESISISSLEQLDTANSNGELIVITFEKTNEIDTESMSIIRMYSK